MGEGHDSASALNNTDLTVSKFQFLGLLRLMDGSGPFPGKCRVLS